MIAWIILTLMVSVAAVGIAIPLIRRQARPRASAPENALLAGELARIEAQAAAEGLSPDLAESLKTETLRRFLAETPAAGRPAAPLGGRSLLGLALGLAAIVALGSATLYATLGRPDLAAAPPAAAPAADGGSGADGGAAAPADHGASMIAALEARMRQTPNDPQGWRMLGWSYAQIGRYSDSARAYGRAAELDPANADYPSAQGESLVRASGGRVTPQAQAAFAAAVRLDPADPRARYFLAAVKDQAGDHAGAMADWIALLKSAPPGAPWAAEVRGFIVRIAASRGEDIAGRLPPAPPAPPAEAPEAAQAGEAADAGPAAPALPADQAAALQQAPPAQQQAMIHAMVDRLAARLKAQPKDAAGWVELMRARMVLGDAAAAGGAYRDAVKAFAGDATERGRLAQAARQLGVPGA
jgi:cytochrome c-type biogenesis protein CcmH